MKITKSHMLALANLLNNAADEIDELSNVYNDNIARCRYEAARLNRMLDQAETPPSDMSTSEQRRKSRQITRSGN